MIEAAANIAKTAEYDTAVFFKSICGCMSAEHGHDLIVELDDDLTHISLSIHQELESFVGSMSAGPISRAWMRVKLATKMLFGRRVTMQGVHLIHDEESAKAYANAILQAIEKLEIKRAVNGLGKQQDAASVPDVQSSAGDSQH